MSFFDINNVVKTSGSSTGTINTTFSAPDLVFDYLSAGEHLDLTYTVKLNDQAGGITTQTVVVTVIGTNDKPIYLERAGIRASGRGRKRQPVRQSHR